MTKKLLITLILFLMSCSDDPVSSNDQTKSDDSDVPAVVGTWIPTMLVNVEYNGDGELVGRDTIRYSLDGTYEMADELMILTESEATLISMDGVTYTEQLSEVSDTLIASANKEIYLQCTLENDALTYSAGVTTVSGSAIDSETGEKTEMLISTTEHFFYFARYTGLVPPVEWEQ